MASREIELLEKRFKELSSLCYCEQVGKSIQEFLQTIPNPDNFSDKASKVQLLLLRGKTRLLMPSFSNAAETDINKALKLSPDNALAWVAISEAQWKRNALQEAKDALESALTIDPKCQPALCQMSRILRSLCNIESKQAEEQLSLLEMSVSKAKEAVSVDPLDSDSWLTLGVALLQQTISQGMDPTAMRKSLSALSQAYKLNPTNPDVSYNFAVVEEALGHFGSAAKHYVEAFGVDPTGLKAAKSNADRCVRILSSMQAALESPKELRAKDTGSLPSLNNQEKGMIFTSISALVAAPPKAQIWLAVKVVELVSAPTAQPLAYLVFDKEVNYSLLLVYRMKNEAIKPGDSVYMPFPPTQALKKIHEIPETSMLEGSGKTYVVNTILADPSLLLVNFGQIPSKLIQCPMLATRQFQ